MVDLEQIIDNKTFEDEHQVYYPEEGWFLKVHPRVIEFLGLEGEYYIPLLLKNKL